MYVATTASLTCCSRDQTSTRALRTASPDPRTSNEYDVARNSNASRTSDTTFDPSSCAATGMHSDIVSVKLRAFCVCVCVSQGERQYNWFRCEVTEKFDQTALL